MTTFVLNLSQFSFKREGWEQHLFVDIGDVRCAVLTGLNAGGKTLVMKSIEKFCDAVVNPDRRKLRSLKQFVQEAGIESIKARFEYGFLDSRKATFLPDASEIPWIRLDDEEYYDSETMADFLNFDSKDASKVGLNLLTGSVIVDLELELLRDNSSESQNEVYTIRLGDRVIIRRRDGIRLSVVGSLEDNGPMRENDCTIWGEWESQTPLRKMERGLSSFGPREGDGDAWKSEVRELTGLKFMEGHAPYVFAEENYRYYDPDRMIRFDVNLPVLHSISDAYSITGETIEEILDDRDNLYVAYDFENLLGEYFVEKWEQKLEYHNWDRAIAVEYWRNKNNDDSDYGEASEDEIIRVLSRSTNRGNITSPDFPLLSIDHFRRIMSIFSAQLTFLELEEMERWVSPENYHRFLSDKNPCDAPIPKSLGRDSSLKSKKYAIAQDSALGFWLAIETFFDDFETIEKPSSGQTRLISLFSALSEMKPGSTIMIDEPELSLHINWQERLISTLITSLPHLQIILATHSPHVIIDHTERIYDVPPRDEV